jgi:hypothetical protein
MLNIAHYPAQNVASLYGLVTTDAPYQPTLPAQYNSFTGLYTGQPNDWTVAVLYTSTSLPGNPLNILNYLALDSQSNVWAVAANGYAVRMSNTGTLQYNIADSRIQTSNFYQSLAVDLSDNLWVDNNSYSALEITSAGSVVCSGTLYCLVPGPGTNQGNLAGNYPTAFYLYGYGGIAVDSSNNLWFGSNANSASGLVETNSSAVGQLIYMGGGLDVPAMWPSTLRAICGWPTRAMWRTRSRRSRPAERLSRAAQGTARAGSIGPRPSHSTRLAAPGFRTTSGRA